MPEKIQLLSGRSAQFRWLCSGSSSVAVWTAIAIKRGKLKDSHKIKISIAIRFEYHTKSSALLFDLVSR